MREEEGFEGDDDQEGKKVIYTTTQEPFMPVRLYYRVHNASLLAKALKKLKCVDFEGNNKFILSYYKEAKHLDLEVYYQDVPEGLYPIILAEGHIKQGKTLHLDIKSLRRAVQVIDFLAKHIPTTLAEITHFAHSNKLTVHSSSRELESAMSLDYDEFFADSRVYNIEISDIDDEAEDIDYTDDMELANDEEEMTEATDSEEGLTDRQWEDLETKLREQELNEYPEVEKFSINYDRKEHDRLINWLTLKAMTKEMMAIEHYKGNVNYASVDALKQLLRHRLDSGDDIVVDKEREQATTA